MAPQPQPKEVADLLTIETLKDTVRALEETKLSLLVNVNELKEKLAQQKDDQADIYYFLNKKCDESFEIVATLEEQLLNEQADREIAEKLYESKIEELRTSAGSNESRLQAKVSELEGKLEMLNSFAENKNETERIMRDLMNKLEEERAQFRLNADTMENRFLLEREKLRKSYDIKYDGLKKELDASMDGKLSKKTQRTQVMNVIMKKELDTQSRHAERLLEVNETLIEKEKSVGRELDICKGLQHETLLKLHAANRKLKAMEEQISTHESQVEGLRLSHQSELDKKDSQIAELTKQARVSSDQLQRSFQETDELWQFLKVNFRRFSSTKERQHETDLDDKEPHERLLIRILREIALKFPEYLSQYVKVGVDIQQRAKSGVHSWDKDKLVKPPTSSQAVQTDEWEGPFASKWMHTSDHYQSQREAKPGQFADSSTFELDSTSVGMSVGAYSVPTIIGKPQGRHALDGSSLMSEIGDGDAQTIKSASAMMGASSPTLPMRKYTNRKGRRHFVHPLDAVLADKMGISKPQTLRKKPVNVDLARREPAQDVEAELLSHLPQISVAGRKFIPPVVLPRI